jgi:hypothetical protein
MTDILDMCPNCYLGFKRDSEEFYWHLKIHNAKKEDDLLSLQKAAAAKQYKMYENIK